MKPAATTIYDNVVGALGYSPDTVPPKVKTTIYRNIYHSRNRTKHLDAEGDHDINFDPNKVSHTSLHRAINNCLELSNRLKVEVPLRIYQFCDEDD